MVTVQDLVDSSTRDDLVDQADDLGITDKREDGSKKSKAELAEDILAAETEDEPEQEPVEVDDTPDDDVEEVVEDAEDADTEEEVEVGSQEEMLVRFSGSNPTLQTGGFTFTKKNPFKVMTEDEFQRLVDGPYGNKFRPATPREAKEFYS